MAKKKSKKVLIVDDEYAILDIYSTVLRAEGYEVITSINGGEGLQRALEETPDLILLDILMPMSDGFTMLEKLRQSNEYGKNVPVVMLTNLSAGSEDIVKKIAQTGPSYYVVKSSLTPTQLVKKLKGWFK